jgi:hypothetical protein
MTTHLSMTQVTDGDIQFCHGDKPHRCWRNRPVMTVTHPFRGVTCHRLTAPRHSICLSQSLGPDNQMYLGLLGPSLGVARAGGAEPRLFSLFRKFSKGESL